MRILPTGPSPARDIAMVDPAAGDFVQVGGPAGQFQMRRTDSAVTWRQVGTSAQP